MMEVGSMHSVPSSVSGSSARSTPVPHSYKPITPSASLLALAKTPDEEIKKRTSEELLNIIRRLESENRHIVSEHSSILKDVNKRTQILLLEVRGLKDVNQNLSDDNQELRDLCCFLDDDRQRGRKLAREWQRFGRYTASVMRSEVSAYQEKLKELETKQQELISDNLDLKELCLYLDQERLRTSQQRDEGDGSSNSTIAGNEDHQNDIELVPVSQLHSGTESASATNDYIRQLENKVRHLEKEKLNVSQQLTGSPTDIRSKETPQVQVIGSQRQGPDGTQAQDSGKATSPHKPEAVVHAMKVLEVHENLERSQTAVGEQSGLDDKEKAIVREMCNVVWRKLGSVKQDQQERAAQSPPVYENLQPSRSKSTPPESSGNLPKSSPSTADDIYPPGYQHVQHRLDPGSDMRADNKRTTGYSISPGYTDSAGYSAPEDYQKQFQGQGGQMNQSQHPPPGSFSQQQGLPPNPHYAINQPKYGYIHTSRSTPVTPTPPQQTQSNLNRIQSGYPHRMDAKSHSPGPVRRSLTPKENEFRLSHSPGPHTRSLSQYPPKSDHQQSMTSGQNVQVYQNHSPSNNRTDNSYENVPTGFYYTTSPSQTTASSHNRTLDSVSSNYDYHTSSSHLNQSQDYYSNTAYQVSKTGNVQRSVNQRPLAPQQRPPTASQGQTFYHNMSVRSSTPSKLNAPNSTPHSPRFASQPNPSASLPQFASARNTPSHSQSVNQTNTAYSSYPQPRQQQVSGQPPGYSAPPSYHDRRTSYVDPRESTQSYNSRDQYYRK